MNSIGSVPYYFVPYYFHIISTLLPKVGQGAGVWIAPAGKFGSATVATPTTGSIVDSAMSKLSKAADAVRSLFSPSPPSATPHTGTLRQGDF